MHQKEKNDVAVAKQAMEKLYALFGILDVMKEDCIQALASSVSDYEDAVVCEVAKRSSMDYIVTRNVKDYENSQVRVLLPDDFIKLVGE